MAKKPTITRREASRLTAEAGAKAYEEAGNASADPKVARALLNVGSSVDVAGLKVRPLMLETFLVLEEVWRTKAHTDATGSLKQALTLWAYCDPANAKRFLDQEPAMLADVRAFAASLSIDAMRELSALVAAHLVDFYGPPSEEKKSEAPKPSKTGRKT